MTNVYLFSSDQPSSASLGGGIIAVIIILLLVVVVVIVIVVFVVRKKPELVSRLRKRGNAGGEEGVKEGGKYVIVSSLIVSVCHFLDFLFHLVFLKLNK